MPYRKLLTLIPIVLSILFSNCSKNNSNPSILITPPIGTMNINVSYPAEATQFELIISEPGGTILLDTLAPTNTPIIAALKTNDTLIDLTTAITAGTNYYIIYSYKSVNAATLTGLSPSDYFIKAKIGATSAASILYTNIPPGVLNSNSLYNLVFTNYPDNIPTSSSANLTNNSITINYLNYAGNYAYLLLPEAGLYNLHMLSNASDTVDCTHMDTAISLTFNRPTAFTVSSVSSPFNGIPDTTDLTKIIAFNTIYSAASRPGVDFEYPNIPVQKYELFVNATNASNDNIGFYCYTSTIPLTLPFPDESAYSLASTQNDNFEVTFPGAKPTYFQTTWSNPNIYLNMYAPSDSGTLHPVTLLANQKSKLLQGVTLSNLAIKAFRFEYVTALNYSTYLSYITNPAAIQAKRILSAASLQKSFP
jgi:hypothetical protein